MTTKNTIVTKPILKGSKKARNSAARLTAVQCWYQIQQTGQTYDDAITDYTENRMGHEMEGELYVAANTELLSMILTSVQDNTESILDMIKAHHVNNNDQADLDLVLKGILMCGIGELMANYDTDVPIIINDYVNVSKAFYEKNEPTLVNSLLDKISKKIR